MNNYTFDALSPLRFENLTRDLLHEKYGNFENFSEGKDGGVDFRYSQSDGKILIVQCKRYKNVRNLISNLKTEERKLHGLVFNEYLLVVSLNLTLKNKEEILKLYAGKIQNPDQIITNSDLNSLLGLPSNHHVEFKYPELWMSSINIHQKIFNLGLLKHSEFIKDKILESLKNFVPYKEYYDLIEHYKSNNIAIVSGNPGMGKTTLSHAIISNFIYFEDYQLIDLSYRKISEAESYLYSNKPTIFFIDDFLGKIKLDKGNDYAQILFYFIEKLERTKEKKLIITSREYIIKKANKELFAIDEINQRISKYIIEIHSFTRRIRTEILYNHLKSSTLNSSFIDNFVLNNFKRIIDHKNYNPRIIDHLTNASLLKNVVPEKYFDFFISNLENPSRIWGMVYDNLPNDLYKLILLVKFLISDKIPVERLEKAIIAFIKNSDKFRHYSFDDFEHIIREMEGTFFIFQNGYDELVDEEYTIIEFQNPSINDFIDSFIWKKRDWLQLIIENAIYYEQLFNWELLEAIKKDDDLLKTFRDKLINDFGKITNSGFGYFEYSAGEEGEFECWIPGRYNYYLGEAITILEINDDIELATFLAREIFRYSFDGTEDISEKIAFSEVAIQLLGMGFIDSERAIKHYISGFCNDIKELVFLEYMTRHCDKESLKIIKNNKELVRDADNLFLYEIEEIEKKEFIDLMDFFDDYTQIKHILPLTKTSKKLKAINYDALMNNSASKLGDSAAESTENKKSDESYYDINDKAINDIIMSVPR